MKDEMFLGMVTSFAKTLDLNQFNNFIKIIKFSMKNKETKNFIDTAEELKKILKSYALKEMDIEVDEFESNKKSSSEERWVAEIYKDEIFKINLIVQNDNLLKKIGGAKIFLYGETGTGKTSIVKKIINDNPSIKFEEDINFTNLISYKMGQTQINLINLANELKNIKEKSLIFVDELDSIITNRENSDLGEHRRIIGTFLNFLDEVPNNIIIIAATNHKKFIDSAVRRRFNIIFETRKLSLDEFFSILAADNIKMEKGKEEVIKKFILKQYFTFSDLNAVETEKVILENLFWEDEIDNWEIFVNCFQEYIDKDKFKEIEWSVRDKKSIKKHKLLNGVKIDE